MQANTPLQICINEDIRRKLNDALNYVACIFICHIDATTTTIAIITNTTTMAACLAFSQATTAPSLLAPQHAAP